MTVCSTTIVGLRVFFSHHTRTMLLLINIKNIYLKVSVSIWAKVSAICGIGSIGIGIGEYLSIGIGGNLGIGTALISYA